jgi:hypothetical protein
LLLFFFFIFSSSSATSQLYSYIHTIHTSKHTYIADRTYLHPIQRISSFRRGHTHPKVLRLVCWWTRLDLYLDARPGLHRSAPCPWASLPANLGHRQMDTAPPVQSTSRSCSDAQPKLQTKHKRKLDMTSRPRGRLALSQAASNSNSNSNNNSRSRSRRSLVASGPQRSEEASNPTIWRRLQRE